jgi:hypothetical protein
MAKILQIIDVDSDGFKVRLNTGDVIRMPHGGEHPHVGQELVERPFFVSDRPQLVRQVDEDSIEKLYTPPTIEQLNSPAQAEAQRMSAAICGGDTGPGSGPGDPIGLPVNEAKPDALDTAGQPEARQESEEPQATPPVE